MVGEKGPDPARLGKTIQAGFAENFNPGGAKPTGDVLIKMEDAVRTKAAENQIKINNTPDVINKEKGARKVVVKGVEAGKFAPPGPEDMQKQEEIRKIAADIFAKRKRLDPGNQETEPSENDLRAAENIYSTMQNRDGLNKPVAEPSPENLAQSELNQAISVFEAKQSKIAEVRAQKTGRFASLAKSLGIKTRNLDNDPEVISLETESHGLYRNLISKGIHLYKGDKPKLENFLRQFDEFEVFKKNYNQELDKKAEVSGFPENILAGLHTLTKKWSELGWKQKVAISLGGGLLFAGGAAALGTGTVGAAALGAGWRWGFRAFGAGAAGVGRNVMLDRQMMAEMEKKAGEQLKERMISLENNLDQGVEDILSKTNIGYVRKDFEQRRTDNELRALKFARNTFIISSILGESFRYASQATGINIGSILKKIGGYAGFGGGAATMQTQEAFYTHGPDGKITGLTPEGNEHFQQYNIEPHESSPGSYDQFQKPSAVPEAEQPYHQEYSSETRATEGNANFGETDQPSDRILYNYDAEGKVTGLSTRGEEYFKQFNVEPHDSQPGSYDQFQKPSVIEEAANSPAAGAEVHAPGIEESQNIKIGVHEVKQGGGIEKSAKAIIKANPKEFGLDPADPRFNSKVGQEAHRLARGLADKYGMSYKELNEIASHKVQAGDEIRVFKDSATGKMNLTYNGAAFDQALSPDNVHGAGGSVPDTSHASAAQEITSNRPSASPTGARMTVEDVKPRAGATEHQPSRGAGKIAGMEEIEARQKLAQQNYVRAVQAEQDLHSLHERQAAHLENVGYEANMRQTLATRGLLNRVVEGAGIGNNVSFWEGSASDWHDQIMNKENYISQDVQLDDQIKKLNLNLGRLKQLFAIMARKGFRPGESNGECLLRIMKYPINVENINKIVLRK